MTTHERLIRDLREEYAKLGATIDLLETAHRMMISPNRSPQPRRYAAIMGKAKSALELLEELYLRKTGGLPLKMRGRPKGTMTEEERRRVGERMRTYWQQRRTKPPEEKR